MIFILLLISHLCWASIIFGINTWIKYNKNFYQYRYNTPTEDIYSYSAHLTYNKFYGFGFLFSIHIFIYWFLKLKMLIAFKHTGFGVSVSDFNKVDMSRLILLQQQIIHRYFVIPEDYLKSYNLYMNFLESLSGEDKEDIFLRLNSKEMMIQSALSNMSKQQLYKTLLYLALNNHRDRNQFRLTFDNSDHYIYAFLKSSPYDKDIHTIHFNIDTTQSKIRSVTFDQEATPEVSKIVFNANSEETF